MVHHGISYDPVFTECTRSDTVRTYSVVVMDGTDNDMIDVEFDLHFIVALDGAKEVCALCHA